MKSIFVGVVGCLAQSACASDSIFFSLAGHLDSYDLGTQSARRVVESVRGGSEFAGGNVFSKDLMIYFFQDGDFKRYNTLLPSVHTLRKCESSQPCQTGGIAEHDGMVYFVHNGDLASYNTFNLEVRRVAGPGVSSEFLIHDGFVYFAQDGDFKSYDTRNDRSSNLWRCASQPCGKTAMAAHDDVIFVVEGKLDWQLTSYNVRAVDSRPRLVDQWRDNDERDSKVLIHDFLVYFFKEGNLWVYDPRAVDSSDRPRKVYSCSPPDNKDANCGSGGIAEHNDIIYFPELSVAHTLPGGDLIEFNVRTQEGKRSREVSFVARGDLHIQDGVLYYFEQGLSSFNLETKQKRVLDQCIGNCRGGGMASNRFAFGSSVSVSRFAFCSLTIAVLSMWL